MTYETIDIEESKKMMAEQLGVLEKEANLLLERIWVARKDLACVHTAEEAREFDATHDLEEGLIHIQLF